VRYLTNSSSGITGYYLAKNFLSLGFGLIIPDGFAGYVFPRSSMAAKGLVCELPPIDSGYRGEIHAKFFLGEMIFLS
jgi:dUTPase